MNTIYWLRMVLRVLAIFLLLGASSGQAQTFQVTTTQEFRLALQNAASNTQDDTIVLAERSYKTTADGKGPFTFLSTDNHTLTIKGSSAAKTIVSGEHTHQVFNLRLGTGTGTISLENISVRNGHTNGDGGGIWSAYPLTISQCTISANSALSGGGLLVENGKATISNSTISDNTATETGGGIFATTTVSNSTVSGNTAANLGGGIYGASTVTNSIISANTAVAGDGGGVYGAERITNSIIVGNRAEAGDGGGLYALNTLILLNSIVIDNQAQNGIYLYGRGNKLINSVISANGLWEIEGSAAATATTDNNYLSETKIRIQSTNKNNIVNKTLAFIDRAQGNFHIGSNSALIGKGLASMSGITFPATDLDGNAPRSGAALNIGPYQTAIPQDVPGAPTMGTATAGNGQATVTFSAPSSNGGNAITGYTATASPEDGIDLNAGTTATTHLITGLTNGQAYTFTVKASNGVGSSLASAPSAPVTPDLIPGAPLITAALPLVDNKVQLTFDRPIANEGSAITGYTVSSTPPGAIDAKSGQTDRTRIVTGLLPGKTYTFIVRARNKAGVGPASAPSPPVTASPTQNDLLPGPPTMGPATPVANLMAKLTFEFPEANEGPAITGYTVYSNPPGGIDSKAGNSGKIRTITGLQSGQTYTFTVRARNKAGEGPPSAPSNPITAATTPAPLPNPPAIASVQAMADNMAKITLTLPTADSGSPITGYTVYSDPPGGIDTKAGKSGKIRTILGLKNGQTYTFTARSLNNAGAGSASAPSPPITAAAIPDPPALGTVIAGNGQAFIYWTPSNSDANNPITELTATDSTGTISAKGTTSPIVIPDLTNNKTYTFSLVAANPLGSSAPSPTSAGVTPHTEIFSGKMSEYTIAKTGNGYTVTGKGSSKAIANIDKIQFADGSKNLIIAADAATIAPTQLDALIEMYVAFFNRIPEAGGLDYWIAQLKAGQSLDNIANNFYEEAIKNTTLTGYTETMSNEEFVTIIYTNVLGRTGARAPAPDEVHYWSDQLTGGLTTRGKLVTALVTAAHSYKGDATWGWVANLLDNKIAVAKYSAVTAGLDYPTPEEDIVRGMAVAAAITPTDTQTAMNLTKLDLTSLVAAPAPLTVPSSDSDGAYTISWAASTTAGATYTLEEATDRIFSQGWRTVATGPGLSAVISGRTTGTTYYYRVKASASGKITSNWTMGKNGCLIAPPTVATPVSLTVPASSTTGSYTIGWAPSSEAGVSYTVEEAKDENFTGGVQTVYQGPESSVALSGRSSGTLYYRVKAGRNGEQESAWRTGGNGCAVAGTEADTLAIQNLFSQMTATVANHDVNGFLALFAPDYMEDGHDFLELANTIGDMKYLSTILFTIDKIEISGDTATVFGKGTYVFTDGRPALPWTAPTDSGNHGLGMGWLKKTANGWQFWGNQIGSTATVQTYRQKTLVGDNNLVAYDHKIWFAVKTHKEISTVTVSGPFLESTTLQGDTLGQNYLRGITFSSLTPPRVGDEYTFTILYADGSQQLLKDTVKSWVATAPDLAVTVMGGVPILTWTNISEMVPDARYYSVRVTGNGVLWNAQINDLHQTSILFNVDGKATGGPLQNNKTYWALIYIGDKYDNVSYIQVPFTFRTEVNFGGL